MPAMVETMFSVREVPWHGLGVIVEEAPNSEEALRLAGLDWDVVQSPVAVNGIEVPKYRANVRSDNGEVLGIVSDRYVIVQNREAFTFVDTLLEHNDVRYETAGSLRGGRQVWMLARLNESYSILGDEVTPYLCFVNTHDGTGAVKVLMTPVRVVCQNTLNLALNNAPRSWSTIHMGRIQDKMIEAQRTLGLAHDYLQNLQKKAGELAEVKVSDSDWNDIVTVLLPIKPEFTERQKQTIEDKRMQLFEKIEADDLERFRGTGWAVVNAVSDYVAHVKPKRQTSTYRENLFSRVIHGDFMLDKTLELLAA